MLHSCLLLLLATTMYLADSSFDKRDVGTERGLEDDDMAEKILERKPEGLEELLLAKALQSVEPELKSQDEGGNIEAEHSLAAMTPQEVHQMETDNIWGDDGSEPTPELLQHIVKEWEKVILLHDADYIVDKYSEECIYVFKKDGKAKTVVGREGAKELFQTWFDSYDYFSLKVDLDTVKGGKLGSEYLWLINDIKFYKENGDLAGALTNTVILKHIPASISVNGKGGFEVKLVSEVRDD